MLKKLLLLLGLGLAGLVVPLWPGRVVTLKVRYAHYACQPCSLGFAYSVTQTYLPQDAYLQGQDVVLYHREGWHRQYFAEYPEVPAAAFDQPIRVLCQLHGRSLLDKLTDASQAADVYKWALARP